jgi:hypothetical protein
MAPNVPSEIAVPLIASLLEKFGKMSWDAIVIIDTKIACMNFRLG